MVGGLYEVEVGVGLVMSECLLVVGVMALRFIGGGLVGGCQLEGVLIGASRVCLRCSWWVVLVDVCVLWLWLWGSVWCW